MCRLLPGEKPRQRKDFGTTSYKKPGPPTPSKNGGRLSLQGNEIQPLREHNDKTPKKVTPSRIKALFMGRPSINSLRENSEVHFSNCLSEVIHCSKLTANFQHPPVCTYHCCKLDNSFVSDSNFVMSENYFLFKTFIYNKLLLYTKNVSFLFLFVRCYLFLSFL